MSFIGIVIDGGLGNQLFQLFCTISYAIDEKLKLIIYSKDQRDQNNNFMNRNTYWHSFLGALLPYVEPVQNKGNVVIYNEKSFEYTQLPNGLADCVLQGYFQSYKYFHHNYDKIAELIALKQKKDEVRNRYNFAGKKMVAMHFRFEDYIIRSEFHNVQHPDYYIRALQRLSNDLRERNENICDYSVLCFYARYNRDEEIATEYIRIIKETIGDKIDFIPIPDNVADWEQMLVMSQCDHFIIANSSFSWFGAYFSENQNKLVYYPAAWFGPKMAHNDTSDLCPAEWTKI
jgi:hypothetical protein